MKKWGLAGNSGAGRKPATPKTPSKRVLATDADNKDGGTPDTNDADVEASPAPAKRAKRTPGKKKATAPSAPKVKEEEVEETATAAENENDSDDGINGAGLPGKSTTE
jgi:hypothetical protein